MLFHRSRPAPVRTTRRRGLFSRSARPAPAPAHHHHGHHGHHGHHDHHQHGHHHATPVVQRKHHVTMGEKISGAFHKIKGTITGRPGEKAAGTHLMHGTQPRVSRRSRLFKRRV